MALRSSDLLGAPSLGGESFAMVLTEAFAAGTPVVASDIAGYRDVARPGRGGLLLPRGDGAALAARLRRARRRRRAGGGPARLVARSRPARADVRQRAGARRAILLGPRRRGGARDL